MAWLSHKWPMTLGIVGFVVVSALIYSAISVQDIGNSTPDEDAYGIAFALLIVFWWGYFFAIAVLAWLIAGKLKSRSIWLLLVAPAVALWVVTKTVQIASSNIAIGDLATSFLVFTTVAAFPILLGASSHISGSIKNFRHTKSAVN